MVRKTFVLATPTSGNGSPAFRFRSMGLHCLFCTAARQRRVRTERDDAGRIEGLDRVVALLDVIDVDRLPYARNGEEPLQVARQVGVVDQTAQVALEQPL